MKELIKVNGEVDLNGTKIKVIEGGFGAENKAILFSDVAKKHEVEPKYINKLIGLNIERYTNNDLIDLCKENFKVHAKNLGLITSNGQKHCYILSERGYIKLVSSMANDNEKKWEVMDEIINNYFKIISNARNVSKSIENIEYKGNINNLVYSKDGQAITTSKTISEVTGKEHFHVLRDIREEIEKLNDIHNPNLDSDLIINDFKKVEYIAENGQTYTQYELGEMATMQLMLKYSTEFRAMFILAFQKMKQAINNMFKVKVIESVLPQDNRLRQYIYVIKNPLNETVKIGVANDVEKRIKQLQTGAGIELELIYKSMICSNAFSIEKDVHKHFEEYRTFGEWFKINPTIVINFLEQQTFVLKSEFMKYI